MSNPTSGTLFSGTSGAVALELPGSARSASRLEFLLNLIPSSSPDASQVDNVLAVISQSGLLAQIPQDETQHKLTVRINSLISAQNALGYQLAHLWIQQDTAVWNDHLVSNAATWATHIVNLISAPDKLLLQREQSDRLLAASLQLAATHLFPENIASRQEFYRQVVHPNLPKLVIGLTQLLESILTKQETEATTTFGTHLHTVLVFVGRLLNAHSAQFRPVSMRLHEQITSLLYRDDAELIPLPIFAAAAAVLSSLHLTGALASKGSEASGGSARTTQGQLWQATLEGQLQLVSEAWRYATSGYEATGASQFSADVQDTATYKNLSQYPKDPLVATKMAHKRLALLLGGRGRVGLINSHLRAATSRPVPVPVGKLISLALEMLRINLTNRFKPAAEARVCSLQAAHLPTLHTRALALIAQLAITAPAAIPLETSRVLGDVCRVAEAGVNGGVSDLASARVKLAAMRTLVILVGRQGIALPLDPAGRTTLRLARLAVTQVAKAVLQPMQISSTASSVDGRKTKKARLYESDSMFASKIALKDRIHSLSVEEIASTQSALQILVAVYPVLTTALSAVHYDQLQLSVQSVLALVESLADSTSSYSAILRSKSAGPGAPTPVELLKEAIEALAELCLDSASSTLAMVLPRAIPVLGGIANAPSGAGDARIRSAAERALAVVHASRKGKFVPIAKGVGFGPRADDDLEAAPEGAKLASASDVGRAIPSTGEALGSSIIGATTAVLGALRGDAAVDEAPESIDEGGEARIDVDAIAAESAELSKVAAADVGPSAPAAPSNSNLGLGRPTSPIRSPVERRIFSPDPVKPSRRPSTPRIGSPSFSHPPALSRRGSPTLDTSAGGSAAFLTPGRIGQSSPMLAASAPLPTATSISDAAVASLATAVEVVEDVLNDTRADVASAGAGNVVEQTVMVASTGDDEDEDEDMPEIDMGESDEDEDEEKPEA